MKRLIKFAAAWLLVAGLALSASGCSKLKAWSTPELSTAQPVVTPAVLPAGTHEDVAFSKLQYQQPDTDAIAKKIEALTARIASEPQNTESLLTDYEEIIRLYNDASSELSLAYLLYAFDVTEDNYRLAYSNLQASLTKLDLSMTDVSIALFESSPEMEQGVRAALGDDFVETVYKQETLNDEKIQDLLNAETELVNEYDRLMNSFTISYQGRQLTFDDIVGDATLDYETYYSLYNTYCEQINQEAGALYVELLGIRTQISETLGYGSYAAYCYDSYGRDYTVTDAQQLHKAVKQYIVPVYINAEEDADQLAKLYSTNYQQQTFFDALSSAAMDFSPQLAESLGYMLRNKLYDTKVDVNKMGGSFTTYFARYKTPFLFTQWTGSAGNLSTIIHELGHFTNYYLNPNEGWSAGDSLDLAEVDSQALELLMSRYYPMFFGELADIALDDKLMDCMYAIITGSMEDEFQQMIYASPNMTLEQMNALYLKLAEEYGLKEMYGYTGTEWVLISHTFQSPMYYISYAVSMLPALELWQRSQTDLDAARTAYFQIVNRKPYAEFRSTLNENHLSDVFQRSTIQELAKFLEGQF